jgi:hypothetical protein
MKLKKNHKSYVVLLLASYPFFIFFLGLSACKEESSFDTKPFFAQISSKEYVVSQIEIPDEGKVLIDTFKRAYNAQNQLIVEDENIFFRYDSTTGKLNEKIICIDPDCQKLMTWQYQYQNDKILVRQFRNGELLQIQELKQLNKQNTSKATDSSYIYLTQEDFLLSNILHKSQYEYFLKDKKTKLFLEQRYNYDSLGRINQIIRIPDRDSTNCVKILIEYDEQGRRSKSIHSRFMPIDGQINRFLDHYKTYTYNKSGRLVEARAFRQVQSESKLFSITKYTYF